MPSYRPLLCSKGSDPLAWLSTRSSDYGAGTVYRGICKRETGMEHGPGEEDMKKRESLVVLA